MEIKMNVTSTKTSLNRYATGYVISSGDDDLFRFQHNYFRDYEVKDKAFVYPVPKLVVVTKGEAEWHIGNLTHSVKEGDIVILRPGVLRRFMSIPKDTMMECDVYEFVQQFIGTYECIELFKLQSDEKNTVFRFSEGKSEKLLSLFDDIKKELIKAEACCGDAVKSLLAYIAVILIRNMELPIGRDRSMPWHNYAERTPTLPFEYPTKEFDFANVPVSAGHSLTISEAIDIIGTNLSKEIDIDALAEAAHMSRSQFYKIFRKYTGMSVNDYILKSRINNTVKVLLNTGCSVLDAAYECGFTSSSGFYKAFKKVTGQSPKEYLKDIHKARNRRAMSIFDL